MKKKSIFFVTLFLTTLFVFFLLSYFFNRNTSVAINNSPESNMTLHGASTTITIEVATTEAAREQGLSGRVALEADKGMLFVFDHSENYGFWMPNMNFPIDIIWVDEQHRIVDIAASTSPRSYPKVFSPKAPARYVLEVNAGKAAEWNWQQGTLLSWQGTP